MPALGPHSRQAGEDSIKLALDGRQFGRLVKRPIPAEAFDTYCLPVLEDDGILADAQKVMSSAADEPIQAAAAQLIQSFDRPVLFAWAGEDNFFSLENARRYAGELKNGRVELISDAFSFTPEDQPQKLADVIARFVDNA